MFVHLECHSHYSFLRGVNSPKEIVAAAVAAGMPGVALTDTNGLYAAVEFYKAAQEAGIVPLIGVSLEVALPGATGPIAAAKNGRAARPAAAATVVLLAMNNEGYANLCRLATLRHLGALELAAETKPSEEDGRRVTLEELAAHNAGVLAVFPSGALFPAVGAPMAEPAAMLAPLREAFGDRLYLSVAHLAAGDGRVLREAERLGRTLGTRLVAVNNVHFLLPEEHLHHRAVNAIRVNRLLTTVAPPEITTPEAWFKPAAEMQRMFPDHPELLRNTLGIAERCRLQLELGKLIFPEFPVPRDESAFSYLWKLAFEGASKRYRPLRPEVLTRLTHELDVIEKLNLAPYFLLVWDIVEEANRRGIPAVARGSAASSMVAYCLGISCVCPLRWGLYFERFLNVQRGDCPDIDIDICGARRDELLDYVYARWGAEHVAMIGSFITMHARLAVREIAKVFGVPPGEVNFFTKRLPHRPVREALEAVRALPEGRTLPVDDEPWKTILEVAMRLDDAPRHLGIHPCGTVISARPLTRLAPLERAAKGIVVTQYDMNAVEALGLIKMDLLGQRGFTTMSLALDNVEKASREAENAEESAKVTVAPDGATPRPSARKIDFGAIPENDPATCDMIAAGRTMGIFQIESPGMRGLLRTMRARTLEEIAAALALIRPGASEYGSKELFLRRLKKQEPVVFPHESLRKILGDTLGVCIYQEQVMQIAQAVGSMSLAEADLVRRSAAKFSGQRERERLRGKFLKAAEQMGLKGAAREEAWMMVEKFAGFGFCKAHAATYADISYRMAYLKTHHTAEFLAAMCSSGAGFYHVSAYVEEAKRWGVEVRLPSVNRSRMEYTAEDAGGGKRALRIGLMQVRGLRVETILAIARERETRGGFRSLPDFLARVPAERDEVEALIKCGALDDVATASRPALLWQWNLLQARAQHAPTERRAMAAAAGTGAGGGPGAPAALFEELTPEDSLAEAMRGVDAPEYTQEQRLRYEREILEVCVSGHPLDFLPRQGETWSDELPRLHGKRVTLCGWVVTHRQVGTKTMRNMMFVTLEDQRGLYEAILFPETFEKYGGLIYETRSMRVTGVVQDDDHINADAMERLRA